MAEPGISWEALVERLDLDHVLLVDGSTDAITEYYDERAVKRVAVFEPLERVVQLAPVDFRQVLDAFFDVFACLLGTAAVITHLF